MKRWIGAWLLVGMAVAQVDPAHVAQAARRTIQIGGDLAQWEGLPRYEVVLSNTFPAKPVGSKGYFSVAWDGENLYLLGVFQQRADTVRANHPEDHGEWWTDDTMEVFLKPNLKGAEYLHLAANPKVPASGPTPSPPRTAPMPEWSPTVGCWSGPFPSPP